MTDYTIINGELYHYGVPGMKWGITNRRDWKVAKKFRKVGRTQGVADHYMKKGDDTYKKHDSTARAFDKTAKKLESKGAYFRAEAARKSAQAIRDRGEKLKQKSYEDAEFYVKRVEKLNTKANKFASKKRVDLGKKTIDKILKDSALESSKKMSKYEELKKNEKRKETWNTIRDRIPNPRR